MEYFFLSYNFCNMIQNKKVCYTKVFLYRYEYVYSKDYIVSYAKI